MERRIAELEDTLFSAEVVKGSSGSTIVQIGSEVTLETGKEKWTITITGPQEADPMVNKISASSPLGEALLGKKKGEKVDRKQQRKNDFISAITNAAIDGNPTIQEVSDYLGLTDKTIWNRVKEFDFIVENGRVIER